MSGRVGRVGGGCGVAARHQGDASEGRPASGSAHWGFANPHRAAPASTRSGAGRTSPRGGPRTPPEVAVVLDVLRVDCRRQAASTQLGAQSAVWQAQLRRCRDAAIVRQHWRHADGALGASRRRQRICTPRGGQPGRQPAAPLPPARWRRGLLLPRPPLWGVVRGRIDVGKGLQRLSQRRLLAQAQLSTGRRRCRTCGAGGAQAARDWNSLQIASNDVMLGGGKAPPLPPAPAPKLTCSAQRQ